MFAISVSFLLAEHCKGVNKPPHTTLGNSGCPAPPAPKLGGLGNFSFPRNSSRNFKEKMPLLRRERGRGWSCRAGTNWEFAKEMHACRRRVGLPFGSSTQTRILGRRLPTSQHPEPFCFAFPTLRVQSGLGAGEDESTASSSELSEAFRLLYSPSSDFHPPASSRERGARQRITIKLNYSGARNFSPCHLSSFLHLVPKQRKITQRSIRKGKSYKTSKAGVLDGTASEQPPACSGCLPGCWTPPNPTPWCRAPLTPVPGDF